MEVNGQHQAPVDLLPWKEPQYKFNSSCAGSRPGLSILEERKTFDIARVLTPDIPVRSLVRENDHLGTKLLKYF
jgi:hypothetical protein